MTNSKLQFPSSLYRKLIVSCQADCGDPLDDADILRRLAICTLQGGAGGLRANGAAAIRAMRHETLLPIIGIEKHYRNGELYITPDFASAQAICEAGADVIALDCTRRRLSEAEPWPRLIGNIHAQLGKPVMADIATLEDALAAAEAGADAVATTLFGYTADTAGQRSVSWDLIENLVRNLTVPIVVEGHITQPEQVRRALDLGAFAAVVGSAITRPQSITARFVDAIHA